MMQTELEDQKLKAVKNPPIVMSGVTKNEVQDHPANEIKCARISHLKKEKSRDAARSRRGKENYEFYELAKLLPVPEETSSLLDKASIVRLTMSFLQLHEFFRLGTSFPAPFHLFLQPESEKVGSFQNHHLSLLSQSLDGFLIVLSKNGRCLYISDTINSYLGLAQVDLIGTSINTFVHAADQSQMHEHLKSTCIDSLKHGCCVSIENGEVAKSPSCSFFVRMKSTLTRRGVNVKSSGFKMVHITGSVCHKQLQSEDDENDDSSEEERDKDTLLGFIGVAQVLPAPLVDIKLDEPTFITRVDASMRVLYCEERVKDLANYNSEEVRGCTIYQFVHVADLNKVRRCHLEILNKGQVITPYYRWLLKNGSFLWVQSSIAPLQDKSQSAEEDSFVWINYVISCGRDKLPEASSRPNIKSKVTDSVPGKEISLQEKEDIKHEKMSPAMSPSDTRIAHTICKVEKNTVSISADSQTTCASKAAKSIDETFVKLIKQSPEKLQKLKRMYSADVYPSKINNDDAPSTSTKRERRERCLSDTQSPKLVPSRQPPDTGNSPPKDSGDVLDVASTMWGNPPNREVSNQSDLNTTVMHHHYPYGIDPNLLNSNPVFAKMLTTNYVSYEPLLTQGDAFLLAPQTFFTPMLSTMPRLVPAHSGGVAYCPPSVAMIVDELRKDPMRKINPPNKVVLSHARIPQLEELESKSNSEKPAPSEPNRPSQSHLVSPIAPSLLSLSNVSNNGLYLAPLSTYQTQGTSGPIFLQPVKLAPGVATFNPLPL